MVQSIAGADIVTNLGARRPFQPGFVYHRVNDNLCFSLAFLEYARDTSSVRLLQ
jgi:hypothetical protein